MAGILAVFISFTMYVLVHWAVCHTLQLRPLSRLLNVLWVCFLPVYGMLFFGLGWLFPMLTIDVLTVDGAVNFLNGLLIDVLLLIGYTPFFFVIERGLSLRVMIEIFRSPEGRMSIDDIKKVYTYDYILDKRLGQMVNMGYAVKDGENIRNTERAHRLIALVKLVRRVFRVEQVMP